MDSYDHVEIEKKWRDRWEENKMNKTERDEDKKPFYLIFAYPGISGFLHLGHMRCYTYTDILARYKEMKGYNVLFPAGTHPTGNQAISLAKKLQEGDQEKIAYMKKNGATEEDIEKMKDPKEVVKYFNEVYKEEYWKKFGFSIDFDYFTHTIREDYKKFITWQFKKLKEKDLLTQKPYFGTECVECGPVAVDPSETDLSKGGNAEKQEFTLLKFEYGDRYVTAATLRPETVFGQTNLWVDPNIEYNIVEVDGEEWIMSEDAMEKLTYQKNHVEKKGIIKGEEMIGDKVRAPGIDREIIILPASFPDPDFGTGIVTSVPSDAPYDYVALKEIKEDEEVKDRYDLDLTDVEPIEIIESEDWGDLPAEKIVEEMSIRSQEEEEKLEEATEKIYKAGFHTGEMLDNCEDYAGMRVQEAKERIKEDLIRDGKADVFYDLSEEVICRCGGKVVVGKIPDQWFIRYSDEDLTEKSVEHARKMTINPQSYSDNLPSTIRWFQDRSCARKGNWMGTEFPFDEDWIIEAIADSTLYPAYYIVAKHYNDGDLKAEQMDEEFFDFVYLGRGKAEKISESTGVSEDKLKEIKKDFEYWYPLDLNLGGKEHMTVHFPVFLMNHVALLDENDRPKGIFVNWWLVGEGGKISKSKGGAEPIPDAAEKYGVDTLRLFYAHSASPFVDKEWSEDEALNYQNKLDSIWNLIEKMRKVNGAEKKIDDYLRSRFNQLVKKYNEVMEDYKLRKGANVAFYDIPSEIEWYLKRGGENSELLSSIGEKLVRLIAPFTPHIAEELSLRWNIDFVTQESLPAYEEGEVSERAEAREEYLKKVQEDIKHILDIAEVEGDDIYIYVAEEWKEKAYKKVMEDPEKGMGIMSEIVNEIDAPSNELSSFVKKVLDEIHETKGQNMLKADLDEKKTLENSKDFLEDTFEASVHIAETDEDDIYDPEGRASQSKPRRPALYIE
ncbi:MAG: leucine--tRNA ligase [Candidatus Thermoplasmatota archaeon]|nr:leucine--tRNA ligase [Candidatus Thermoplasmatota archaeon]